MTFRFVLRNWGDDECLNRENNELDFMHDEWNCIRNDHRGGVEEGGEMLTLEQREKRIPIREGGGLLDEALGSLCCPWLIQLIKQITSSYLRCLWHGRDREKQSHHQWMRWHHDSHHIPDATHDTWQMVSHTMVVEWMDKFINEVL